MASQVDQKTEEELAKIASAEGCELLEVELKGGTLRLTLDHPDGVTLEHCESFSRQASLILDLEDTDSTSYVLEVSSPGLDRKLYGPNDYRRFRGELVRVTFRDSATGDRKTVVGTLGDFDTERAGGSVAIRERESQLTTCLPLTAVEAARLEIDI